ncbi:trafficking protein particle complex subunit 8 [Leptopilina boulardi]|uniref:trafficking protein particle complex subunit 8 n=1 Tax=Leptopilina boulardi TaxID=63433 RepID=UPI0021F54735|nr:trafficking protein particle complex subunit 8 [Leptopilina boulardi]
MAQCKSTAREFIVNTFSPQVAAVCSNNAETTCQKNNLSFTELLQPFCRLSCEGHIKDPLGNTNIVRCLQISIRDVNNTPPEPTIARRMLNETVSSSYTERSTIVNTGSIDLSLPLSIPWFEAWRDTFLNVQYPSDHEFTRHFLACMIVVSTSDDEPLEIIQQMAAKLNQSIPGQLPKWFNNNVLRYYILIHDTSQDNKKKAEDVFREMKNIYGVNNCFLLQMNSRPPGQSDDNIHLPDPWSQFIVKNGSISSGSGQNSSPRTPADTSGVSAMPYPINTDSEKIIQVGTPLTPQASNFPTTDFTDLVNTPTEINELNVQLEIGQEAVPITIHPLSPLQETIDNDIIIGNSKIHLDNSPINVNVWADSPGQITIGTTTIQHGTRLSLDDLERLKFMMSEFYLKSLLPYVERQIGLLNDVISNKKGVSRSLFSATKRWFGTSKPGVPGSVPANVVIYTSESPELQLRRLGDLYFMFGLFGLAYQAYHNAKRDFAVDQAWLYYAGALEMAALSAFMQDEMTRKTIEYMDDAILTYLNTCKMPQFATRATLLSAECLKNRGLYSDAAKQLIRMTSEDSDLRSALLLEQAAYCFIGPKMIRKYAFHIVIAGHRFSKAGQKKHSLRCYQQAYQVYCGKGWSFAEDHIHFTLGRQAHSLKQTAFAVTFYEKLLNPTSKQPALQQAAFLREFLHTTNALLQESKGSDVKNLSILPLPLINGNEIKVLPGPYLKGDNNLELVSQLTLIDSDNTEWSKLEEQIVTEAQGSVPMIFKPSLLIYTNKTNNSQKSNVFINEPIFISIQLYNPLEISLPLTNIKLLWSFETKENEILTNESNELREKYFNIIEEQLVDNFLLQSNSKQDLILYLKPKILGSLQIIGICYNLSSSGDFNQSDEAHSLSVCGKRLFEIKGPKLKHIKEKPNAVLYGNDYRLSMNVIEKAPFMEISLSKLSPEMLSGEIQNVELTLKNIGNAALTNVHVGFSNPKLISFTNEKIVNLNSGKLKNKSCVHKIPLNILNINENYSTNFWIRAPTTENHKLDLLFYYENSEFKSKYRIIRYSLHLTVLDSIQINAITRASCSIINDANPTLNLILKIKNMNQVHDPFINEIELIDVALQSKNWSLINNKKSLKITKIHPQQTTHFLLKLKQTDNLQYSNVKLMENFQIPSITTSPYIDFIKKRNNENTSNENELINSIIMNVNSILILRWKANVMERNIIVREAIGQQHIDIMTIGKYYNEPIDITKIEPIIEYGARLKIFGPDANVDGRNSHVKIDKYSENECQKNILCYSLKHVNLMKHNFQRKRFCSIPIIMTMQNNSSLKIDVKINTIGTSSQTHLPSIKSQLYTPQASTFYRYAGHTAIECDIEPFGNRKIKLQVIIPASGTYDLASRLDVSIRFVSRGEYIPQKWHIESICIVNNELS